MARRILPEARSWSWIRSVFMKASHASWEGPFVHVPMGKLLLQTLLPGIMPYSPKSLERSSRKFTSEDLEYHSDE
jgi:hypothetical protein